MTHSLASEAVEWFSNHFHLTDIEAVKWCQIITQKGLIENVVSNSPFTDSKEQFWRFTTPSKKGPSSIFKFEPSLFSPLRAVSDVHLRWLAKFITQEFMHALFLDFQNSASGNGVLAVDMMSET